MSLVKVTVNSCPVEITPGANGAASWFAATLLDEDDADKGGAEEEDVSSRTVSSTLSHSSRPVWIAKNFVGCNPSRFTAVINSGMLNVMVRAPVALGKRSLELP